MASLQDRIADMNTIAGFLVPVYSEDPLPGREVTHALTPADMQKVQAGYACPRCLADFGTFYRIVCPMCLHERDVEQDFAPTPQLWLDHQRDRAHVGLTGRPSIDERLGRIMRDPDIDHATTKQLMPSRMWGRGRPR